MISIIVPIYGVERFLPKCIESLLAQEYPDIELILVEDGSPDRCGEICDRYAATDSRIKVIHQPNAGVSAARNAGLEIAGGEYIGFCDPDDFVAPDMYSTMLDAMQRHDVDMAACGYNYYSENYESDKSRLYREQPDELLDKYSIYSRLADIPPTIRHGVVTKLFRRSVIDTLRFDARLHSAEDADFLLTYISRIETAVFVHRPLYMNLVRIGSATHGGLDIQSLLDSFAVHDRMYCETVRRCPRLRSKAVAFVMDVCTLKYNDAKSRIVDRSAADMVLRQMRRYLRRRSLTALLSRHIRLTTKIYYLLIWIRN